MATARFLSVSALLTSAVFTSSCGGGGGGGAGTPPPSPAAIVFTPAVLAFAGVGAATVTTVNVSESGYSGDFTVLPASSTCLNSAPPASAGPVGKATIGPLTHGKHFTIIATQAGTCGIVLSDASGHSATLQIRIAVTTVGGS